MNKRTLSQITILISYTFWSLFSLMRFPFVHSDEIWLLKLSQQMDLQGSLFVTEPFFDLFPRVPHAIKILYHGLQITWAKLFGYTVFQMRLLTLCIALIALVVLSKFIEKLTDDWLFPILVTSLMAVHVQFVYMSHFARQEALILLGLILLLYVYQHFGYTYKGTAILAIIISLTIGFHPNSFLLACLLGPLLAYDAYKSQRIKPLLIWLALLLASAIFYVLISYFAQQNFISAYRQLGTPLGVNLSVLDKIKSFPIFLYKLYHQISGTYIALNIRATMIVAVVLIALALSSLKQTIKPLLSIIGLTIGLIIIGRYNATSIVFYIPLLIWLYSELINRTNCKSFKLGITLLLALMLLYQSSALSYADNWESFTDFNQRLKQNLPADFTALANLNQAMALDDNQFYDYRNLDYLDEYNLKIAQYLDERQIDIVIWSEELDYIHRNIIKWDILYGEMPYYDDLKALLKRDYQIIDEFNSPQYGMRIAKFADGYPWKITIYQKKK